VKLPGWKLPTWVDEARLRRLAVPVGSALVVILLVAGGIWAWLGWQDSRSQEAMAEAMVIVQQATAPEATPETRARAIQALEGVLRDHSRTSVAAQAAYLLGNLQYGAGQYAAARGAYEAALAKGASGTLRALSAVGIGYTWEAEKNYGAAVSAFNAALGSMGPKDFLYEETLVALARSQALGGQAAAALETYQRVLKDVPDSPRAEDLKTRVAELKSRVAR
jgi:tetratricopeptide (TPR) repeat protein